MSTSEELQRVRTLLALSLDRRWLPASVEGWNLTPNERERELQQNPQGDAFQKAISAVLEKTGAILAGGSVLSAVNNDNSQSKPTSGRLQDLDFYVKASEAKYLLAVLLTFGYNLAPEDLDTPWRTDRRHAYHWGSRSAIVMAPSYDQSFFRKNHIIARVPLGPSIPRSLKVGDKVWVQALRHYGYIRDVESDPEHWRGATVVAIDLSMAESIMIRYDDSGGEAWKTKNVIRTKDTPGVPIDVMIVPDNVEPTDVASNFDLTFCQIWYNGTDVIATDWDDVREKKGELRESYVESLVKYLNPFIRKRMIKYCKRGYRITYRIPTGVTLGLERRETRGVISAQDWLVNTLWKTMVDTRFSPFAPEAPTERYTLVWEDESPEKKYTAFATTLTRLRWLLENTMRETIQDGKAVYTLDTLNEIVERQKDHTTTTEEYYKTLLCVRFSDNLGDIAGYINPIYMEYITQVLGIVLPEINGDDPEKRNRTALGQPWYYKQLIDPPPTPGLDALIAAAPLSSQEEEFGYPSNCCLFSLNPRDLAMIRKDHLGWMTSPNVTDALQEERTNDLMYWSKAGELVTQLIPIEYANCNIFHKISNSRWYAPTTMGSLLGRQNCLENTGPYYRPLNRRKTLENWGEQPEEFHPFDKVWRNLLRHPAQLELDDHYPKPLTACRFPVLSGDASDYAEEDVEEDDLVKSLDEQLRQPQIMDRPTILAWHRARPALIARRKLRIGELKLAKAMRDQNPQRVNEAISDLREVLPNNPDDRIDLLIAEAEAAAAGMDEVEELVLRNDEVRTLKWLSTSGDHLLVWLEDEYLCFNISNFLDLISQKGVMSWQFECTGEELDGDLQYGRDKTRRLDSIDFSTGYAGVGYVPRLEGSGGAMEFVKAWVPVGEILALVRFAQKGHKVFSITPVMVAGVHKLISHTTAYKAAIVDSGFENDPEIFGDEDTDIGQYGAVSSNHCQAGSSLFIYSITALFKDDAEMEAFAKNESVSGVPVSETEMREAAEVFAKANPIEPNKRTTSWDVDLENPEIASQLLKLVVVCMDRNLAETTLPEESAWNRLRPLVNPDTWYGKLLLGYATSYSMGSVDMIKLYKRLVAGMIGHNDWVSDWHRSAILRKVETVIGSHHSSRTWRELMKSLFACIDKSVRETVPMKKIMARYKDLREKEERRITGLSVRPGGNRPEIDRMGILCKMANDLALHYCEYGRDPESGECNTAGRAPSQLIPAFLSFVDIETGRSFKSVGDMLGDCLFKDPSMTLGQGAIDRRSYPEGEQIREYQPHSPTHSPPGSPGVVRNLFGTSPVASPASSSVFNEAIAGAQTDLDVELHKAIGVPLDLEAEVLSDFRVKVFWRRPSQEWRDSLPEEEKVGYEVQYSRNEPPSEEWVKIKKRDVSRPGAVWKSKIENSRTRSGFKVATLGGWENPAGRTYWIAVRITVSKSKSSIAGVRGDFIGTSRKGPWSTPVMVKFPFFSVVEHPGTGIQWPRGNVPNMTEWRSDEEEKDEGEQQEEKVGEIDWGNWPIQRETGSDNPLHVLLELLRQSPRHTDLNQALMHLLGISDLWDITRGMLLGTAGPLQRRRFVAQIAQIFRRYNISSAADLEEDGVFSYPVLEALDALVETELAQTGAEAQDQINWGPWYEEGDPILPLIDALEDVAIYGERLRVGDVVNPGDDEEELSGRIRRALAGRIQGVDTPGEHAQLVELAALFDWQVIADSDELYNLVRDDTFIERLTAIFPANEADLPPIQFVDEMDDSEPPGQDLPPPQGNEWGRWEDVPSAAVIELVAALEMLADEGVGVVALHRLIDSIEDDEGQGLGEAQLAALFVWQDIANEVDLEVAVRDEAFMHRLRGIYQPDALGEEVEIDEVVDDGGDEEEIEIQEVVDEADLPPLQFVDEAELNLSDDEWDEPL